MALVFLVDLRIALEAEVAQAEPAGISLVATLVPLCTSVFSAEVVLSVGPLPSAEDGRWRVPPVLLAVAVASTVW